MKSKSACFAALSICVLALHSQAQVTLEYNGTSTSYSTIEDAIKAVPHDPQSMELDFRTSITVAQGVYTPEPGSSWREGSLFIPYRGTPEKTLSIVAAPGARPVIKIIDSGPIGGPNGEDPCTTTDNVKSVLNAGVLFLGASYCHFRGFEIDGEVGTEDPTRPCPYYKIGILARPTWGYDSEGNPPLPSHHIVIEDCEVHDCSSSGISFWVTRDSAIVNCDSHHNTDELTPTLGDNADGFNISTTIYWDDFELRRTITSGTPTNSDPSVAVHSSGNRIIGCRAWRNSDDGFDAWGNDAVVLSSNESWENGFPVLSPSVPGFLGNGEGFKLGRGSGGHTVENCTAWANKLTGFSTNSAEAPCHIYNCTSSSNGQANFRVASSTSPHPHTIANCVSHRFDGTSGPTDSIDTTPSSGVVSRNNSWDLGYVPNDSDFLALPPVPFTDPDPRIAGGHLNPWNLFPSWSPTAPVSPLFVPNFFSTNSMVDLGYTTGPLRGQLAIGFNNDDNALTPAMDFNRYRAPDLGSKEVAPIVPSGVEIFLVQATAVVHPDLTVSPALVVLTAPGATELRAGTVRSIDDLWQGGADRLVDVRTAQLVDSLPAGNGFLVGPEILQQHGDRMFLQADDGTAYSKVVPLSLNVN